MTTGLMITPKHTKPKLVKYTFKDLERIAFKVDIVGEEYDMCVDFSKNMWANKKKGEWGRGMMNTDADPYKTERTGIIGEMGYAKLENIPVDMMYREGGDDYDFVRNDKKINIKTSHKEPWYQSGLVKAGYYRTKDGQTEFISLEIKHDYFVFGFLTLDDIKNRMASVIFVGGCDKETLINRELKKAIKGSHMNYQIHFNDLTEMRDIKF